MTDSVDASEYSDSGHQQSCSNSSEDNSTESETDKRKSNQKVPQKRKRTRKVASDNENSSEDEGRALVVRTSKKRKKNLGKTHDHNLPTETPDFRSGAETEKRDSPVEEISLNAHVSTGDETDEKDSPNKRNGSQSLESDDSSLEKNESTTKGTARKNGIKVQNIITNPENGSKVQQETEQAGDSSSDSDSPLSECSVKKSNSKQKSSNKKVRKSLSDSSDGISDTDEENQSLSREKELPRDESSSSESSTPHNILKTATKEEKKLDRKRVKNKIKKDSGNAEKTDPKIERLKKYLRVAGLRVRSYQKLWEGCKSNKAKKEKLLLMLSDAGLKGKPTLQKCKRLQAKRERKDEVESLDVGNIIASSRGRPKRNTLSLYLNPHTNGAGEKNSLKEKSANAFSRIKNIVDSEDSD